MRDRDRASVAGDYSGDHPTLDCLCFVSLAGKIMRFACRIMLVFGFALPVTAAEKRSISISDTAVPHQRVVGRWRTDFHHARSQAIDAKKNLLIHFMGISEAARHHRFVSDTCCRPEVHRLLEAFVCVRLPYDYSLRSRKRKKVLLHEPDFEVMQRHGGLAVVNFSDHASITYGQVIGGLPFMKPNYYAIPFESPSSVATLLGLPSGTLAERMMIYAIRMHPESPRSTAGVPSPVLRKAASAHSQRQARLGRQGHQQWQSRFEQIRAQIGGKPPVEVCAESWPDESLLTACLGCVHAWRQSTGHWNSVAGSHPLYAYSIHRGNNRIWYATGIFGG